MTFAEMSFVLKSSPYSMVPPIEVTPQGHWAMATTASLEDQGLSDVQEQVSNRLSSSTEEESRALTII